MTSVRCPSCREINGKLEGNNVIIRTGFGKRRRYHTFNKDNSTLTCWNCSEIFTIGGNNGVKR